MRVGVDLGGTKIEAAGLNASGHIVARERIPTPRAYDASLDAITRLIEAVAPNDPHATVGIGIPGAADPVTGIIKNANSQWLIGKPLARDLEAKIGRPVRVMNDANCFAISEAVDGAAAGAHVVVGVILGTGVGGGIVVDGRVLDGPNLIAGEWGHVSLPWMRPEEFPGPRCYCGRDGCVEMFLSGPGMAADFVRTTGRTLTTREIEDGAASGDAQAAEAIARYHDRLARGLAMLANILDPDVIVLGGGMSNVPRLAEETLALMPKYVFSDSVRTRVVKNLHGDSSGVRGAAWLWPAN